MYTYINTQFLFWGIDIIKHTFRKLTSRTFENVSPGNRCVICCIPIWNEHSRWHTNKKSNFGLSEIRSRSWQNLLFSILFYLYDLWRLSKSMTRAIQLERGAHTPRWRIRHSIWLKARHERDFGIQSFAYLYLVCIHIANKFANNRIFIQVICLRAFNHTRRALNKRENCYRSITRVCVIYVEHDNATRPPSNKKSYAPKRVLARSHNRNEQCLVSW